MRKLLFMSIALLALTGCSSSAMYSMPRRQSHVSMTAKSMPQNSCTAEYSEPAARSYEPNKAVQPTKTQAAKPKTAKRSGKSALNEAMGVSVKLFKDSINYIKPRLAKLTKR